MKFDIYTHNLVPKHTKLNKKEIEELLNKYNISKRQLPRISKNDPAIKNMKLEVGDVVKIKRKSPTYGEFFFYRVVVNG
jgi:DNA-directed RNA polymerase subunit H